MLLLARERFEHKRSLLECATVKGWSALRFAGAKISGAWEDAGRAFARTGMDEAFVATRAVRGLGKMPVELWSDRGSRGGCSYVERRRLSDNVGKTFPNRPQHFGESLISRDCRLPGTIVSI